MTLDEKISKLHALEQDFKKLTSIVGMMRTNEDSPVYNSDWAKELKRGFKEASSHAESLVGDLKL